MAKTKYNEIYMALREKMEDGTYVRDGKVWIDTSNVNHVNFVCGNIINDGTTVLGERFKDTLNHAEYALKGHETYIRVEAVDKYGRTAWTNPIYLEW